MNNKVTFVTCIYDDLYGSELGGRSNPTRKYYYGVESALKMDSPYVIFCWPKDVEKLDCDNFGTILTNLTILVDGFFLDNNSLCLIKLLINHKFDSIAIGLI